MDTNARSIGFLTDLLWSQEGKLSLIVDLAGDGTRVRVPFSNVRGVGDMIIVESNDCLIRLRELWGMFWKPNIRTRIQQSALDRRVFAYVQSHGGTFSRSEAAQYLRVSAQTLNLSLSRLMSKGLLGKAE